MKFHYDLTQAEPIIRDYPCYNASATGLYRGQVMALEGAITTAANRMFLQTCNAAVVDNVVGVLDETSLDATTSSAATGVTVYGKVIINPMAVWLAEYSQHADNDTVNTSADSTGKTTTATFTTDREGDWIYVTGVGSTAGGAGNLSQIGASTSTTSVTAVTSYDDYLKGTNTSDTFIVLTSPFSALAAGGSIDLSAATGENCVKLKGVAAAGTGAVMVLQNYVTHASLPMEPLKVARHSGNNYPYATTKVYADVMLTDHLLLGATLSTRVID